MDHYAGRTPADKLFGLTFLTAWRSQKAAQCGHSITIIMCSRCFPVSPAPVIETLFTGKYWSYPGPSASPFKAVPASVCVRCLVRVVVGY
eukprot:745934-Pyramimonas_sp.AAC.1